jgi:hypothetical protein
MVKIDQMHHFGSAHGAPRRFVETAAARNPERSILTSCFWMICAIVVVQIIKSRSTGRCGLRNAERLF